MTTFDDRKKAFENKYVLDEENAFKINAKAVKKTGLWAAGLLGKDGEEADAYAKQTVMADFEAPGDDDVVLKLLKDFAAAGIKQGEPEIRQALERFRAEAHAEVMDSKQ